MPVSIHVPNQDDIWHAASLKGSFPISYADAFAAALAQKHNETPYYVVRRSAKLSAGAVE